MPAVIDGERREDRGARVDFRARDLAEQGAHFLRVRGLIQTQERFSRRERNAPKLVGFGIIDGNAFAVPQSLEDICRWFHGFWNQVVVRLISAEVPLSRT
jgi:hypothetical protein